MNQYHKYLKSSQWSDIRDEVLSRDNSTCQQCGSTDNPTVHHKSYAHIFHEQGHLEDLITLCRECHNKIHNKANSYSVKEIVIKKIDSRTDEAVYFESNKRMTKIVRNSSRGLSTECQFSTVGYNSVPNHLLYKLSANAIKMYLAIRYESHAQNKDGSKYKGRLFRCTVKELSEKLGWGLHRVQDALQELDKYNILARSCEGRTYVYGIRPIGNWAI